MNIRTVTRASLAFTITAALAVTSGCATVDNATQSLGHAVGIKNDTTTSAVSGGVIGCGAGLLIGHMLMHQSALGSCAIGGAVGAVSAVEIHKHQVEEARKLAAEANAAGAVAVVKTKTVEVVDSNGQKQPTETLSSLTIDLKPADVRINGADTTAILAKAAHVADASQTPVTITAEGTPSERTWLDTTLRADLKPGSKTTVDQAPAKAPRLVLAPIPDVQ